MRRAPLHRGVRGPRGHGASTSTSNPSGNPAFPKSRWRWRGRWPSSRPACTSPSPAAVPSSRPRSSASPSRRGSVEAARFAPDGQVVLSAAWRASRRPSTRRASRPASRAEWTSRPSRVVGVSRQGRWRTSRSHPRPCAPGWWVRPGRCGRSRARRLDHGWRGLPGRAQVEGTFQVEFPIGTVLCDAISPTHGRIAPDRQRVAFLEHPVWGDRRRLGGGGRSQGRQAHAVRRLGEHRGPRLVAEERRGLVHGDADGGRLGPPRGHPRRPAPHRCSRRWAA